jgi:hypothetical protein
MSAAPGKHRFPWLWYWLALALILIVGLFPVPLLFAMSMIAESNGCTVNEGGIYPCMVNGTDWGTTLAMMGMSGWLLIVTVPAGLVALGLWLLALIAHLLYRARARGVQP